MPSKALPVSTRAIGIARQSSTRDGDKTVSIPEQRKHLEQACAERGLELIYTLDEPDVSGGTPLAKRKKMLAAVEAVEAGEASVIIAVYFDRLFRSLQVQAELVERVERAGGQVLALDTGEVTSASAGQWLSGTMLGAVAEYHRRTTAERVVDAQAAAVARGAVPYPVEIPGYLRDEDSHLSVDLAIAPLTTEAFRLRMTRETIAGVRAYLAAGGVHLSYRATQGLLASRLVLGEIHFGRHVNLTAHEPIVDRATWEAVQRVRSPQGRKAKSDRLLARLGVLICGGCGRPMVVGSSVANGVKYHNYRCSLSDRDCRGRQVVSARIAEQVVWDSVRTFLSSAPAGTASTFNIARQDAERADLAEDALQQTLRTFIAGGVAAEPGATAKLIELRAARDAATARAARSATTAGRAAVTIGVDADTVSTGERRDLIKAVVSGVVVSPGRGADRVAVLGLDGLPLGQ